MSGGRVTNEPRAKSSADGWRGVIGADFTPAYAGLVASCVLRGLPADAPAPSVLVTYDGRRSGPECAAAVAAAAAAAGAKSVRLVPHLPTPVASAALSRDVADLAFLVTASHNASRYNGIKVKVAPGCSLPAEVERRAEHLLAASDVPAAAVADLAPEPVADRLIGEHVTRVVQRTNPAADARTVVVDGVGGVAGPAVARLCTALGWQVHLLGGSLDPDFGGLVPDPTVDRTRDRAAHAVRDRGADLGIVLDGDGDRIVVVDDRGRTVQPHELLALLLRDMAGGRPGDLAVTAAVGMAVRTVARRQGRAVRETPIGFKHLSPLLVSGAAAVAGGSVGDLAFAEYGIDRDPFVAVALLAGLLGRGGARLGELLDDLTAAVGARQWFESRVGGGGNAEVLHDAGRAALAEVGLSPAIQRVTSIDGVKFWLDGDRWMLLRGSSTEGGVRVYGELAADGRRPAPIPELLAAVGRALQPSLP
ncbi:phosphoglucomutase [Actinoplanes teichomyceticus]|uniref:Phosphomannomutase n=1 Tax=Actinoplanes teichomyceticus TaxID=1867 RepID=A0A561VIL8_ACTTI|nr:phosphoglucomutase [Actinoplanes teichomyceticus]TWG11470.1 phosphomannomutase [Actinoplanes teichomyceticus]GIF15716.1 phosphomannomutase [Actinoplanes teichomyceticus]